MIRESKGSKTPANCSGNVNAGVKYWFEEHLAKLAMLSVGYPLIVFNIMTFNAHRL